MSADQGQLERDVEEGVERLERAGDALYEATVAAGEAERVFKQAQLVALAYLEREYQERKMPAQDIREALIFPRLSNEWDAWFRAKTRQEAIEKSSRLLSQAVSARQSLLKARAHV